jgi:DNA polymerase-3 subunit epsilon
MRQIFLDTETTGLSADAGDRIVEIGCIEMVDRRLSGRNLHLYLNPQRSSHPDALKVHGLTDTFLADKPFFAAIADQLAEFVQGAEVIIHNAGFDVGFLDAELRRAGRPRFAQQVARVTDSLLMAREMYPGKANSLDALCKRLEVDNRHRSFHAGLLAEVYVRLTRGQKSLVIDSSDSRVIGGSTATHLTPVDFRQYCLPVLPPSAEEEAAHQAWLLQLDETSGGKTVWRPTPPVQAEAEEVVEAAPAET